MRDLWREDLQSCCMYAISWEAYFAKSSEATHHGAIT